MTTIRYEPMNTRDLLSLVALVCGMLLVLAG